MSVRSDGIDINSESLAAEQNHASSSESMGKGTDSGAKTLTDLLGAGGVDQGLISVSGSGGGVRCVQDDSKSNVVNTPIPAIDVGTEMGLKGDKNEGVCKGNSEVSVEEVVDRTRHELVKVAVNGREEGVAALDQEVGLDVDPCSPGVDSGLLHACDKPGSSGGVEIDVAGTEVEGGVDRQAHLVDGEGPHINGIGSNGKQELKKEIKQPQDTVRVSAELDGANMDSRMIEFQKFQAEKGLYHPGDLVWGKVRSHPWWPGQIFSPSDASEQAMKYSKKDGFLIAYFGDKTFAWNEASQIKPFRLSFSRMEKQSNSEAFCHAMACALEEVSRRVEFGLACSCLPDKVYSKIKTQVVVNAGVREESSRRDGSDEFSSAASFRSVKLLQCLKALAQCPSGGIDRLEFTTARSQLQAFSSWKGVYQLPEFKLLGSWPEDVAESPTTKEIGDVSVTPGNDEVDVPKKKLTIQESSSGKRKKIARDSVSPTKKEKRVSDLNHLTPTSGSNVYARRRKAKGTPDGGLTSSSAKRFKKEKSVNDDLETETETEVKEISMSPASKRKFSSVGESIRKVARQLSASKIPKDNSVKASGENGSRRQLKTGPGKSKKNKDIQAECPPPADMLSQLHMAAADPWVGGSDLLQSDNFFSGFRNSICLENSTSPNLKNSPGDVSGELTLKDTYKEETTEEDKQKGTEDDNSTGDVEERVIFEVETTNAINSNTVELEGKPAAGNGDEKAEEEDTPTALILNFTNPDSVPSELNLRKIFTQYGQLCEPGIEIPNNTKRAKVIFKRRCDADTAFSSAGKFSVFGHSLVSYRLHYAPIPKRKSSPSKRGRKGSASKKQVKLDS